MLCLGNDRISAVLMRVSISADGRGGAYYTSSACNGKAVQPFDLFDPVAMSRSSRSPT